MKKAIFLDRDGTINIDSGYTHKFEQWEFMPGALTGLQTFTKNGWLLIVVSNQSGIGRGYYTCADLHLLQSRVDGLLSKNGINIAAWEYCPHLPDAGCNCRKPEPGMITRAADRLGICLDASWMLGDKLTDVEAGYAAGCQSGLITVSQELTHKAREQFPRMPVWANLTEAAEYITTRPCFHPK